MLCTVAELRCELFSRRKSPFDFNYAEIFRQEDWPAVAAVGSAAANVETTATISRNPLRYSHDRVSGNGPILLAVFNDKTAY